MGKLGLLSTLGLFAFVAACSSSSTSNTGTYNDAGAGTGGAGAGGAGATKGTGGTATAGGSGSTGTCNMPACLTSLMSACAPSGTCVEQLDLTTFSDNVCFSNGVKVISTVNATTSTMTLTYKNGSSTCYTVEMGGTTGNETLTVKNAAGAVVGTGTATTAAMTFTCTGGQPVTLNSNCDNSALAGDSSDCSTGTCAP